MITNDIFMYMDETFYTLKEVSELLKVSKLTVRRYINAGSIPAYKLGRDLRIKQSELEIFIESRRQPVKSKK